jgi:hypothetical protein
VNVPSTRASYLSVRNYSDVAPKRSPHDTEIRARTTTAGAEGGWEAKGVVVNVQEVGGGRRPACRRLAGREIRQRSARCGESVESTREVEQGGARGHGWRAG